MSSQAGFELVINGQQYCVSTGSGTIINYVHSDGSKTELSAITLAGVPTFGIDDLIQLNVTGLLVNVVYKENQERKGYVGAEFKKWKEQNEGEKDGL